MESNKSRRRIFVVFNFCCQALFFILAWWKSIHHHRLRSYLKTFELPVGCLGGRGGGCGALTPLGSLGPRAGPLLGGPWPPSLPHPKWWGLKLKTDWLLVGGAAVAVSEAPVRGDLGVDPLIDMGLGPVVGPPELLLRGPPGLLVLRPLEEVKEGPRLKKQGNQVFKTTAIWMSAYVSCWQKEKPDWEQQKATVQVVIR